jgi:nucleoside-diphosphate-sugar epimerase
MTHHAAKLKVPLYFSSVCIYRDMPPGEPEMTEVEAIPAHPDNEKLCSECMAMTYGRDPGMTVRIALPELPWRGSIWTGRREKAPAAICLKVAKAEDGGTIEG